MKHSFFREKKEQKHYFTLRIFSSHPELPTHFLLIDELSNCSALQLLATEHQQDAPTFGC